MMTTANTTRNELIKAAFIAGNTNKSELARYFGVSPSTVRRVLAGVIFAAAVSTAASPTEMSEKTRQLSKTIYSTQQ